MKRWVFVLTLAMVMGSEPASLFLLGFGLVWLAVIGKRHLESLPVFQFSRHGHSQKEVPEIG
jgi:hypothetical protein